MLTKSDFIKYLQCKKYLWLYKHRRDLLPKEINAGKEAIFSTGYEVEEYAYKLFIGGIDAYNDDFKNAILKTNDLIKKKVPVIFQPTISRDNLFCRADIIKYNEETDNWDIIEVKSSTQVKDIHYKDLSFQKICFDKAGINIGRLYLIHVNNQYVKNGDIEPEKLLEKEDITNEVEEILEDTKIEIKNALDVIKLKDEPDVRILRQCNNPYECDFIKNCWKDIPNESIYSIAGALGRKKLNLLLDKGIIKAVDIPVEMMTNKKLQKYHHAVKKNTVYVEKENIKKEIDKIKYPIYYLDYETYAPAIPIIDGYRPYQRIVFQYSLHIQDELNGEVRHYHFLAKDSNDPTKKMSESLQKLIGETGSIIAWNMGFEKGCNSEMGERVVEYRLFYEDVNNRMYDLMSIFKSGYYVHKDFSGSASLKKVLPVMVPGLDYNELDISEGMTASNSWGDMITKEISQKEKDKTYNGLLEYCELDTLAMVKILDKLNSIK